MPYRRMQKGCKNFEPCPKDCSPLRCRPEAKRAPIPAADPPGNRHSVGDSPRRTLPEDGRAERARVGRARRLRGKRRNPSSVPRLEQPHRGRAPAPRAAAPRGSAAPPPSAERSGGAPARAGRERRCALGAAPSDPPRTRRAAPRPSTAAPLRLDRGPRGVRRDASREHLGARSRRTAGAPHVGAGGRMTGERRGGGRPFPRRAPALAIGAGGRDAQRGRCLLVREAEAGPGRAAPSPAVQWSIPSSRDRPGQRRIAPSRRGGAGAPRGQQRPWRGREERGGAAAAVAAAAGTGAKLVRAAAGPPGSGTAGSRRLGSARLPRMCPRRAAKDGAERWQRGSGGWLRFTLAGLLHSEDLWIDSRS